MSIPRYPEFKDSGVAWLGEVPAEWTTVPLWALFRRTKRTGYPEEELLSVYRDHGVIPKSSRDDNHNNASEDLGGYQLVEPGCMAINKMKAWQGSVGISEYRGIVSPAYFIYEPQHNYPSRFLHYLLRSQEYTTAYMMLSKGIRVNQWDLDPQYHSRLPVLLPTHDEQSIIADFLDWETAKIDALVAEQERLIELLKEKRQAVISHAVTKGLDPNVPMRDSGVEWLGLVPAHWVVKRLKFVAFVQGGVAKGRDLGDADTIEVPYLRVANVQDGYLDFGEIATIKIGSHELPRYALHPGDVLMNEGGDFDKLGRGHIWRGEIETCIHQNHVFAVRPISMEPEWLNLLTSAAYGRFYFMSRSKQSTNLASISSTNISEFPLLCPPKPERMEIVRRVQEEIVQADELLDESRKAIDLLKERRSALISAAVTGKIDVRGHQEAT